MRFFDTYIEPSKIRYKITVDLIIKDFVFNDVMKGGGFYIQLDVPCLHLVHFQDFVDDLQ
jgi:hypothetical protein